MLLKTAIASAVILVGVTTLISSTTIPRSTKNIVCNDTKCVNFPTKLILTTYRNLFYTTVEIEQKLDQWAEKRKELYGQPNSFFSALCSNPFFERQQFCRNWRERNQDFDLCCPTQIHHMFNDTLVNTDNIQRILVKFTNPDRMQFIPEATCLSGGGCFLGYGTCRVDTISMWLLVFNVTLGPTYCEFNEFEIPAYCSCKTN